MVLVLVDVKMKNKFLVSLNNLEEIEIYKKEGINSFLLPLKDYTVGYPNTYSVSKINSINETKYCLINKVLDNKEIDNLEDILPTIDVKGFVIEDIGLIRPLKALKKEIILFINHFNCNYNSINEWLNYVDSVFVSNELTKEELEEITKNAHKPVVLHLFGYNQVMYSKRSLVTNYETHYHLPLTNTLDIEDKMGQVKFHLYQDEAGTVALSNHIATLDVLYLPNVYYYYLNTSFIPLETTLAFLRKEEITNSDEGFLRRATVFKIGDLK